MNLVPLKDRILMHLALKAVADFNNLVLFFCSLWSHLGLRMDLNRIFLHFLSFLVCSFNFCFKFLSQDWFQFSKLTVLLQPFLSWKSWTSSFLLDLLLLVLCAQCGLQHCYFCLRMHWNRWFWRIIGFLDLLMKLLYLHFHRCPLATHLPLLTFHS